MGDRADRGGARSGSGPLPRLGVGGVPDARSARPTTSCPTCLPCRACGGHGRRRRGAGEGVGTARVVVLRDDHTDHRGHVLGRALGGRRRPVGRGGGARRRSRSPTGCAGRPGTTRRRRCTAATASSTTRRSRPTTSRRRRDHGSRCSTSTTTTATAPSRSSTSATTWRSCRCTATRRGRTRTTPASPTRPGAGRGRGSTTNVPLAAGSTTTPTSHALDRALDAVDDFDPAVVVVSLGLDTFGGDPICDLALTTEGFRRCGAAVAGAGPPARHPAGGRLRRRCPRRQRRRLAHRRELRGVSDDGLSGCHRHRSGVRWLGSR